MAVSNWTIIYDDLAIYKQGAVYEGLDLSWLPSDILAVQVNSSNVGTLEKGDRETGDRTQNVTVDDVTALGWWPNVETTWQNAYDKDHEGDLSSLVISEGTLTPDFSTSQNTYNATVGSSVNSITVTPTTVYSTSTVTVNNTPVVSGQASAPVSLSTGENEIVVFISGELGTISDYVIFVTKE